jgi:transcriptional regulator with XRE-family HTH domain
MRTGETIKNLRLKMGLTADDVADFLGVSRATVFRYENGDIEKVPAAILEPLSKILMTTPAYLMGWEDDFERPKNITRLPLFNTPVSAGLGQMLSDGNDYELCDFSDVPNGVDFALTVRGDSMEPLYFNNDIVFIKTGIIDESGQIGVFLLNDEGYLKMLQGNRLVSLNNKYKPVTIGEFDSFYCVGRAIGKSNS